MYCNKVNQPKTSTFFFVRHKWQVFFMGGTALGSINPNFIDPQLHEIVFLWSF